MKPFLPIALICASLLALQTLRAQESGSPDASHPGVVLTKLSPPVYPPLARTARIMGDVVVDLQIKPDGTIASVLLFDGHPMLAPAAIENVRKAQFACSNCTENMPYRLTYTFGFVEDFKPYDKFEDRPVRASKCLYLWKCGVVRVNLFDFCTAQPPPEISQTPGYVKILAFPVCVETESAVTASR